MSRAGATGAGDSAALSRQLVAGAAAMDVQLDQAQVAKLLRLIDELRRWNRAYNLTAITEPAAIVTHHLLDSLAAQADLAGTRIADVGTGAGFPGLPLAVVNPSRQFTLIDAVDKKLRFVGHAARELGLANVRTHHGRVEQLGDIEPFDTVIARAFAPLPRMLEWIAPLCGPATRVVAMKGHWPPPPDAEDEQAPLPAGWRVDIVRPVQVPGLGAARHHVLLQRAP